MSFLNKLNLRPQERRTVVLALVVVFMVLNFFFVWPHAGDFTRVNRQIASARDTLGNYQQEIARTTEYQTRLDKLQRLGSAVLPSDQAVQLLYTIQDQARLSDVLITGTRTQPAAAAGGPTNQFFDEQSVALDTTTGKGELVAFLLALGSGDSMIRVRDLDLHTDPQLYRLLGKLTLVASYQKKPKLAPPPAVATNTTPARPGTGGAPAGGSNRAAAPQPVKLTPPPPGRPPNNVPLNRTNRLKS
jgi:hypothetical protein